MAGASARSALVTAWRPLRVCSGPLKDHAMALDQFGAKPAVLRCGRCGKFVDWEDAHVQIVCTCRAWLDLPPVLVREVTDGDRPAVSQLFEQDFGRTRIVAFGDVIDIDAMPALVAI